MWLFWGWAGELVDWFVDQAASPKMVAETHSVVRSFTIHVGRDITGRWSCGIAEVPWCSSHACVTHWLAIGEAVAQLGG